MIWWIAQTACVSALLAAVVALVSRAGRLSPAVKHALWLLVLLKLLTPPLPFYPLPAAVEKMMAERTAWLTGREQGPQGAAGPAAGALAAGADAPTGCADADPPQTAGAIGIDHDLWTASRSTQTGPSSDGPATLERLGPVVADTELPSEEDADLALTHPDTRLAWLFVAWLVGAVPLAVVQSLRIVRLRRLLTPSTRVPGWLDRLVRQVAAQLNIRPPRVVILPALCSPLICALGRPRLLWPAGLSDQLSHEARQAVLLHELAHLRRRDHWVAWLELAAGVLWWFNPLYWYVRYQLRENAELACDAWVVGLLPSGRRAYAQALIEVTEFVSFAPAAMPAVAMGNVARRTLERRLTMIMRERTSYRVPLLGTALIGLSLLAILPGWSGGQENPASEIAPAASLPKSADRADPQSPSLPIPEDGAEIEPGQSNPLAGPANAPDVALSPPADDKEQRIQQLEAQLNQLQAAVQALRGGKPVAMRDQKPIDMQKTDEPSKPNETPGFWGGKERPRSRDNFYVAQNNGYPGMNPFGANRAGYQIETLTRARYELSEETANALATFVTEHVKSDVEVRTAGNTLTVIASQEDQAKIGAFIELLRDEALPGLPGGAQRKRAKTQVPQGNKPGAPNADAFAPEKR